ncbi:hypothetical protein QBC43DRAFT_317470 [Cladorrhinum sp. PSN259]|nr:hypothetical protein QBC43DRAFT_317470 [Cladorrhinum sp. PSN259]
MNFVSRQDGPGPNPAPALGPVNSPLDLTPYKTVPLFNKPTTLLALTISFMVFSWICCLLRLYTRLVVHRAAGWDDFFLVLSQLSTTAGSVILCILAHLGFGSSIYTMDPLEVKEIMKMLYFGSAVYPFSITFIKIALLFQYLRIFEPGSGRRVFCKCMIALVAVWGTPFAILSVAPCYPVSAYWDFSIRNARCWAFSGRDLLEFMHVFVAHAITTAVLDFIVFIIPVRLFFKPNAKQKLRLSLVCLFVLGLITNMCSIWRMVNVIGLSTAHIGQFDPSWYAPTLAGLASLEGHLAATCAALPVFWPTLKTTWNRIFVTHEVSVTREEGVFRPKAAQDVELQSLSSSRKLALDQSHEPEGWEPFVGDETTGLGENETVIQSPAVAKPLKACLSSCWFSKK